MKRSLITVVAIALVTSSSLFLQPQGVEAQAPAEKAEKNEKTELKPLPALRLMSFDGKAVKPADLGGSVYVINFWATWCGPCIAEIPAFNQLQAKYADRGLKIVGVTMASGEAKEVKPLADKFKMKYTVLMGDDEQTYDLQVVGFPTTYVVTKDWKIYKKYLGMKVEQIEMDIQKLLDVKP